MSYSSLLQDTITIWAPTTNDGFGGLSYSSPVQILGRWQDDNENFQDADGEEFVSAAIIYTSQQLVQNGWCYNGVSAQANPQNQSGAYRIRRLYTTSTPNDSITVYKSILG